MHDLRMGVNYHYVTTIVITPFGQRASSAR